MNQLWKIYFYRKENVQLRYSKKQSGGSHEIAVMVD